MRQVARALLPSAATKRCQRPAFIFGAQNLTPADGHLAQRAAFIDLGTVANTTRVTSMAHPPAQARLARRPEQLTPVLQRLFAWVDEQFDKLGFLSSSPFLDALAFASGETEPARCTDPGSIINAC